MAQRSYRKPPVMFLFGSLALLCCSVASAAEMTGTDQEICHAVESAINKAVDHTETTCMYSDENEEALSFRIASSERVFANEEKKKAWVVGVVAAVGKVMNKHRTTKVDELWLADVKQEKRGVGHVVPVELAKSLKRSVDDGKIGLDQMYVAVQKKLDRNETDE